MKKLFNLILLLIAVNCFSQTDHTISTGGNATNVSPGHVSGILSIANGGANTSILGAAGTIPFSDGTKYSWNTGTTSTGLLLQSNGTAAPGWSSTITSPTIITPTVTGTMSAQTVTVSGKITSYVNLNSPTATYTLVLTDASNLVRMNVGSANNLEVPLNATYAFPIGTQILVEQMGAGQTTITAAGGVTINSAAAKVKLTTQYSAATLIKTATDTWFLSGDLTP